MPSDIEITGIDVVLQHLQALGPQALEAARLALAAEAQTILAASESLVPVLTGLLRATGEVEMPVLEGTTVSVAIRYGGNGLADYAALIEFDHTMNHPRGGQAGYLSQPFYAAEAGMAERLAATIRQALGG
jgi:hypothetical protein